MTVGFPRADAPEPRITQWASRLNKREVHFEHFVADPFGNSAGVFGQTAAR